MGGGNRFINSSDHDANLYEWTPRYGPRCSLGHCGLVGLPLWDRFAVWIFFQAVQFEVISCLLRSLNGSILLGDV